MESMCIVKDTGPRRQTEAIAGLTDIGNKRRKAGFGLGAIGDRKLDFKLGMKSLQNYAGFFLQFNFNNSKSS
jgi:hypothetical protein